MNTHFSCIKQDSQLTYKYMLSKVKDDNNWGVIVKSSWLQIQMTEFNSRRYQIFWELMGLERGPLSLVSIIEELFERKKVAALV
jgi:hypothetical protein